MIRPATHDDLVTLLELEQAASTAALGHVFGPDIPFPVDDVLARWALVLDEPDVAVVLDEVAGGAVGFAAFGNGWLQHLGVLPTHWGTGCGRALHDHALAALAAAGADEASLWVLVENHRARAFYDRLGWADSGDRDREVFEPYPVKLRMTRALPAAG